jgi:hypothetical protein
MGVACAVSFAVLLPSADSSWPIGAKGEREFEALTTGSFGRRGLLAAVATETDFRYGVDDGFRASLGQQSAGRTPS